MNKTLTIILMMVMAGVAWGEETYDSFTLPTQVQSPTNEMKAVALSGKVVVGESAFTGDVSFMLDTNMNFTVTKIGIRKLAKSGKICEAMGFHCCEPYNSPSVLKQPLRRKCKLCGKVETGTMEWK